MTGTLLNIITVLIGGLVGLFFGSRLSQRFRQTVILGLGLFTAAIGVQLFLKTGNPIVVLVSLLAGGILGEWWQIEDGLRSLGAWLENRFGRQTELDLNARQETRARFVRAFLTSSLVFCVGP